MNSTELDTAYTALAHALTRVGQAQSPLFLSMLCLSLMSRNPEAVGNSVYRERGLMVY